MNVKIKWLRDQLKSQNLQGMIVSNPVNIKYLTGIEAEGTFLLTLKENIFITDSRYVEAVNSILTIDDEILVNDIKNLSNLIETIFLRERKIISINAFITIIICLISSLTTFFTFIIAFFIYIIIVMYF